MGQARERTQVVNFCFWCHFRGNNAKSSLMFDARLTFVQYKAHTQSWPYSCHGHISATFTLQMLKAKKLIKHCLLDFTLVTFKDVDNNNNKVKNKRYDEETERKG